MPQNLLEENRERERLGLVTPLEVLQAESEILNQQEAIIQADRAIEDAEDALRRAMGEVDFSEPITESFDVDNLPERIAALRPMDVVVLDTLKNDDDAKAQERRIEVERINRMLAEDATRPNLDLTAGVDYLGRDTRGAEAQRGALRADGSDWNVGLGGAAALGLSRGKGSRAASGAKPRTIKAAACRHQTGKSPCRPQCLALGQRWLKRIEVTRAALALNEKTFEQERARFGSGVVPYRNVLEAQRDLDRAQSNYLRSVIETLRATVRLSRVDGSLFERNGLSWTMNGCLCARSRIGGWGPPASDEEK